MAFWNKKKEDPVEDDPFDDPVFDQEQAQGLPPPPSNEDLGFNEDGSMSHTAPPKQPKMFGAPGSDPGFEVGPQQQAQQPDSRDMQIVLAKLDSIKSELDSIAQRVQKIERIADQEQAEKLKNQRKAW